ncbi:hypothetical protein CICLE_v10013551mg [Citrus x clementina]|uniref:RRM domain-containing protein n=1 Tax=Citrus clementina TaxID=85681 RepID=V4T0P0_CITCL|nr:hypothetical protein CICLE_v10013551mg [Citrus x clementina]
MEDVKKRKMEDDNILINGQDFNSSSSSSQDHLRSLLDPLSKSQLVDLLSRLGSQYPSIAEEIKSVASADPVHRKLFVRGLAWNTTSETLCAAFRVHGEIEEGAVIYDKATGKSRGYGFITYKHMESTQSALRAPSKLIDGRLAVCNLACEGLSGVSAVPDLAQRKLYIGGLSPEVTTEVLLNFFGRHGEIEEGSVAYDKDTNESRGFGFVTYKTVEAAKKAVDDPHKTLGGRTIIVKLADTHKGKPPQTQLPAAVVPVPLPLGAGYPQAGKAHANTPPVGYSYPQNVPPYPTSSYTTSILGRVSSNFVENPKKSLKIAFLPTGSFYFAQTPRLFSKSLPFSNENVSKSPFVRKEAQAAMLEYLHLTRNLPFMDAEHMSKNSPHFVEKLIERFENQLDVQRLIARFLRYHPINEFEPFFESLGLKPCEYSPFLPLNLMFLSDDELLLENYHVLCNYGVVRNKIGKILKEAREVFQFDVGVFQSKLHAYEMLGLSQSFISKVIVCSPYLLIGDVNTEFVEVLEILKSMEIESCWIEEHLLEQETFNWSMMLRFLRLFRNLGCSDEQLGGLIRQHPGLLFEGSGSIALTMIGLLLKFGSTRNELCSIFLQFPRIEVRKFLLNLNQCLLFLFEIKMKVDEIGKILRCHFLLVGSCTLKKTNTILAYLNVGKKRLCEYIQENPLELKKLALGSRVGRLPAEKERSQLLRTKFLLDVGYIENSNEMAKALKHFRGRGAELQERFDCLVNAVSFPSYFNYTEERIKLRFLMYNWLKDEGWIEGRLASSTLIAYSNKTFMQQFVNRHPKGPEVWQTFKKQIYSEE